MTAPPDGPRPPVQAPPGRPADVDTAFWLWLAALPLMTCGYVVNLLTAPELPATAITYPIAAGTVLLHRSEAHAYFIR